MKEYFHCASKKFISQQRSETLVWWQQVGVSNCYALLTRAGGRHSHRVQGLSHPQADQAPSSQHFANLGLPHLLGPTQLQFVVIYTQPRYVHVSQVCYFHFTELTFAVGLAFSLTPVFSKAARNYWPDPLLVFPDQNVIYTNLCTFYTIKQLLYFPLNTSGVEHNPKGSLRKQCLPKGVLNAQKCVLYFSKGTCQNPADTSSIEKYLPSAISSRISLPFYMFI